MASSDESTIPCEEVADIEASPAAAPVNEQKSRQERVDQSYKYGDVSSLVKHHAEIDLDNTPEHPEASAGVGGDYIKSFVFGGLDGICSTFALVTGLAGASVPIGTLIAVGVAKVIADAFSMGFGEFASATAEMEHVLKLKAREIWETENHEEGEVKEMCEIYMQKGCQKEDALTLMTVMAKYKELFIDHMLVMEHGVMPPEDGDKWAPVKQGFVCFIAFIAFGLIPLLGFIIFHAIDPESTDGVVQLVVIAYCLTALTLFVMGVTKAKLIGQETFIRSGLMMVFNGTIAGGVSFLVGEGLVSVM
eukprot:TRINITY_DN1132_c0_g1_i2.p1 TRINITY_DN1132_c0_g1~~TRINITY_DN1132_c0_g1_i2.p1  ORF type:complete len:325 (-),score=75.32 TRINITY_DN1132_c0_g1_i2:208-1122(-)